MRKNSGGIKYQGSAESDIHRAYAKTKRDAARAARIAEWSGGHGATVAGIMRRMSEPSTYAGLAGMAAMFGMNSEEWHGFSQVLMIIFSALAVFMRERGDGL